MNAKQIDKLAVKALHGLLAGQRGAYWEGKPALVVKEAYAIADAMAEERRKRDAGESLAKGITP